jgi:hypothetical protein
MVRFCALVLACVCWVALGAPRAAARDGEPKPAKKINSAEAILAELAREFSLREGANINDIPFFELLQDVTRQTGVAFVINEASFRAVGQPNFKEEKPLLTATGLRGLTLHQFLMVALDGKGAVPLVRNGAIEIVSVQHAAKVLKVPMIGINDEDNNPRLAEPLVSLIVKEKPLNEVVAKLAEMYDLSVVISPQSGDARTGLVTAHLLNVPPNQALELLVLQRDLRVVRRGTAYLITTRDHAKELFDENLAKERKKIELQRLRW